MGQSQSSESVPDNARFIITTKAHLIKQKEGGNDDKKPILNYLKSPAFKKRATSDLNSNFESGKKVKVTITNITVSDNFNVKIEGQIKALNKKEGEPLYLVKDSLETSLPHYSSSGEPIPNGRSTYRIQFKESDTKVTIK